MTDNLGVSSSRLAVDFDETLTDDSVAWWEDEREEPNGKVIETVRQHYYAGGSVIVWTSRPWSESAKIAARLTEWEMPYHGIRCEKGSADIYIDDKAYRPEELE